MFTSASYEKLAKLIIWSRRLRAVMVFILALAIWRGTVIDRMIIEMRMALGFNPEIFELRYEQSVLIAGICIAFFIFIGLGFLSMIVRHEMTDKILGRGRSKDYPYSFFERTIKKILA